MPLLEFMGFLLLLAVIVGLAAMASRALGLRVAPDEDDIGAGDQRWLDELAVLQLEERHPVC